MFFREADKKSCGKFIIGEETNYDEKGTGCECKKGSKRCSLTAHTKKVLV